MATVLTTCRDCGDVKLSPRDVIVLADLSDQQANFYRFICPIDRHILVKEAEPRIIDLLLAFGCELTVFESEVNRDELDSRYRISERLGAITLDEQINFGLVNPTELATFIQEELIDDAA